MKKNNMEKLVEIKERLEKIDEEIVNIVDKMIEIDEILNHPTSEEEKIVDEIDEICEKIGKKMLYSE